MITWDENMSTGLPLIDAQHKMLFDKFNEFSTNISDETATNVLDFLQFYATWHFAKEEEYMAKYDCPAADLNKQAHAEFLATFGGFYEQWQTGSMSPELVNSIYKSLEDWLVNHILQVDTQLHAYVSREQGVRSKE